MNSFSKDHSLSILGVSIEIDIRSLYSSHVSNHTISESFDILLKCPTNRSVYTKCLNNSDYYIMISSQLT